MKKFILPAVLAASFGFVTLAHADLLNQLGMTPESLSKAKAEFSQLPGYEGKVDDNMAINLSIAGQMGNRMNSVPEGRKNLLAYLTLRGLQHNDLKSQKDILAAAALIRQDLEANPTVNIDAHLAKIMLSVKG